MVLLLIPVAARSEAWVLIAWMLRSRVLIPLKAWMFILVFMCCVVLCRGLCDGLITRSNVSYQVSKQIKEPPVCQAAKVLSVTIEEEVRLLVINELQIMCKESVVAKFNLIFSL
jgi:phage gp36-like protein